MLLEKQLTGTSYGSGTMWRHVGEGSSQANAETVALSALNVARKHRYSGAPGRSNTDANSPDNRGQALTVDVT